jgi:hypothetical protein
MRHVSPRVKQILEILENRQTLLVPILCSGRRANCPGQARRTKIASQRPRYRILSAPAVRTGRQIPGGVEELASRRLTPGLVYQAECQDDDGGHHHNGWSHPANGIAELAASSHIDLQRGHWCEAESRARHGPNESERSSILLSELPERPGRWASLAKSSRYAEAWNYTTVRYFSGLNPKTLSKCACI